jgi:hypothetical protein
MSPDEKSKKLREHASIYSSYVESIKELRTSGVAIHVWSSVNKSDHTHTHTRARINYPIFFSFCSPTPTQPEHTPGATHESCCRNTDAERATSFHFCAGTNLSK